jgi:hypothetical protein
MNIFEVRYFTGDFVVIDGCKSVKAVVLASMIRGKNISHQVSYWGNGCLNEPWIEEWRLTPWAE